GIRDADVTGVQTCALPILAAVGAPRARRLPRRRDQSDAGLAGRGRPLELADLRGHRSTGRDRRGSRSATVIRRAKAEDAPAIHALIHRYAGQDLLLPRPLTDIYDRIRDFWVATDRQGGVVGCVPMRIWWHDLAEVRSLAVDTDAGGRGYGGRLVDAVAHEAQRYGVKV